MSANVQKDDASDDSKYHNCIQDELGATDGQEDVAAPFTQVKGNVQSANAVEPQVDQKRQKRKRTRKPFSMRRMLEKGQSCVIRIPRVDEPCYELYKIMSAAFSVGRDPNITPAKRKQKKRLLKICAETFVARFVILDHVLHDCGLDANNMKLVKDYFSNPMPAVKTIGWLFHPREILEARRRHSDYHSMRCWAIGAYPFDSWKRHQDRIQQHKQPHKKQSWAHLV